ncbi:hypothetical protein PINS_up007318 [Pythium insidiosum]|nr:hypothetical protein PINS_up007318 [Pythium insidiosum]
MPEIQCVVLGAGQSFSVDTRPSELVGDLRVRIEAHPMMCTFPKTQLFLARKQGRWLRQASPQGLAVLRGEKCDWIQNCLPLSDATKLSDCFGAPFVPGNGDIHVLVQLPMSLSDARFFMWWQKYSCCLRVVTIAVSVLIGMILAMFGQYTPAGDTVSQSAPPSGLSFGARVLFALVLGCAGLLKLLDMVDASIEARKRAACERAAQSIA